MSRKHHNQGIAEQINEKGHASAPFHYEEKLHLLAYQIHQERGGSELDNWLEAEQILMNPTNSLATSNRTGSGGVA